MRGRTGAAMVNDWSTQKETALLDAGPLVTGRHCHAALHLRALFLEVFLGAWMPRDRGVLVGLRIKRNRLGLAMRHRNFVALFVKRFHDVIDRLFGRLGIGDKNVLHD